MRRMTTFTYSNPITAPKCAITLDHKHDWRLELRDGRIIAACQVYKCTAVMDYIEIENVLNGMDAV